jgi:glucose/arabinose dehydrogenase
VRRPALVAAAALAALTVLAGCGGDPAPAPPPATAPAPAPAPSAAPAQTPEDVVCADYTDTQSVVRQTAEAIEEMPVLPAGVAVLLLGARQVATTSGVTDPEIRAAQTELVAAIDDLDAQGRALLGPDGNAAQDAVRIDAARILAAVTEIERVCAATA